MESVFYGIETLKLNNMNLDRIKEIQETTGYPESVSVKQALLQVWNECAQEQVKNCSIPAVSKCRDVERRNLLIAYGEWIHSLAGESNNELSTRLADKYLESN